MPRRPVPSDYYGPSIARAADDLAPARCPGCGSAVRTTLRSDPMTPVYMCNSTPDRIVCVKAATPWTDQVRDNLSGLTEEEAAWVVSVAPSIR